MPGASVCTARSSVVGPAIGSPCTVDGMRNQFLLGVDVVLEAVSDPRVVAAWNDDSILEGQSVGSLASHLARGSVCVVLDYLAVEVATTEINFDSAAEYFAVLLDSLTDADHESVRQRGADVAQAGPTQVGEELATKIDELRIQLASQPADRLVSVYGGTVMRLDDYLWTRIVEQVVHLDDLARSLDIEPWANPPDAEALAISCGAEIGRQRRGGAAMIRSLVREPEPGVLPVL